MPAIVKLNTEHTGYEIDLLATTVGLPQGFKLIDEKWTPNNAGFEIFTPEGRVQETIPLTCDKANFNASHDYLQHIIRAARQHSMNPFWVDYAWFYYSSEHEDPKRALITNAYLQPLILPGKSPLHTDRHVEANLIIERLPWWEAVDIRLAIWNDQQVNDNAPQTQITGRGTIPGRIKRLVISAPATQTEELAHFWIGIKERDAEDVEGGPGQVSFFRATWPVLLSDYALLGSPYATLPIGAGDTSITWRIDHNGGQFGRLFEYTLDARTALTIPPHKSHYIGRYLILADLTFDNADRTLVMRLSYGTKSLQADHIFNSPVEISPINTNTHWYEIGYVEIPAYSMRERNLEDIRFNMQLDAYILDDSPPPLTNVTIRNLVLMPANHISIRDAQVAGGLDPVIIRRHADDTIDTEGTLDIHTSNQFMITPTGGEVVIIFQRTVGQINVDRINIRAETIDRFDTWKNDPTIPVPFPATP